MKLPHQGNVDAVAFTTDGISLATAGGDNIVRIWDVATGNEVRQLTRHTQPIVSLAFSRDRNPTADYKPG
jgi:WD40 repeat protein